MSATNPEAKAAPPPEEKLATTSADTTDIIKESGSGNGGSGSGGLWGWRNRLMNWRNGGVDSKNNVAESGKEATADTQKIDEEPNRKSGDKAPTPVEEKSTKVGAAADNPAPIARPMNIWLRRALERQVESAIAEAVRDGKPIPATAVAAVSAATKEARESAKEVHKSEGNSNEAAAASTGANSGTASTKVSFADLMRQHREGLLAPTAQPSVKATKVVKKPKSAKAATAAAVTDSPGDTTATIPTNKKRKSKATPAAAVEDELSERKEGSATAANPAAPTAASAATAAETQTAMRFEKEEGETKAKPATTTAAGVHQGAVRKRAKTSSLFALNSASATRSDEVSAAASVTATPTQTITVKGKVSLEELRARRNRTTSGSVHNTPSPLHSSNAAAVSKDEFNESALDAISQLLSSYCLGDRASAKAAEGAAAGLAAGEEEQPSSTATSTTSELAFFCQLMQLCENNSLTPASLELLRELFQHVRVLPRPATMTAVKSNAVAEQSSEKRENNTTPDCGAAAAPTTAEVDAEAYREASRRREYVQQVVMVLINRLKQMKLREQQQERQQQERSAIPPQLVIDHTASSIKVGGVPLNPLPRATATTLAASAPRVNTQQQQQHQAATVQSNTPSYDEQMQRLVEWRAMADVASGASAEDEAVAAAAFASTMAAYGYPNPYAHLTVFSHHQPVAPPVGWLSGATSGSLSGFSGTTRGRSGQIAGGSNVAARLVPSPFPGAFPIIPPPSSPSRGGVDNGGNHADESVDAKEDREMQELFRMIRTQLTQPTTRRLNPQNATSQSVTATAATTAVDVSQAERAILRHVQEDFKKQQQQKATAAATSSAGGSNNNAGNSPAPRAPPTASTPPSASLDTPAAAPAAATTTHRTFFTPQGKQSEKIEDSIHMDSLPPRSATTTGANEEKQQGEPATSAQPAAPQTSTLNFEARPFVRSPAVTAAANSTSTKTTFNYNATPFVPWNEGAMTTTSTAPHTTIRYEAKPFVPRSDSSTISSTAAPQSRMNASARAFVPAQQPQQNAALPTFPVLPHASFKNSDKFTAASVPTVTPGDTAEVIDAAGDPWASYAMFARWRDMMEAYYQGVFAAQQATWGSFEPATPPRRV